MTNVQFSINYAALKMFGKQLYSNVSSAISELIANGLDANASKVWLTVDIRKKESAYVEILDDGKGMTEEDISNHYVVIGYNKRQNEEDLEKGKTMGRKGIGKLAALYLSDCFYILTKTLDKPISIWKLDVSSLDNADIPELQYVSSDDELIELNCYKEICDNGHGTAICLKHVNMVGMGDRAFESLTQRLSTLFLYDQLKQEILIKIIKSDNDFNSGFERIKKRIAYRNLVCVYTSDKNLVPDCIGNKFHLYYKTKNGIEKEFEGITEVSEFSENLFETQGKIKYNGKEKEYSLTGWVGIHASIDNDVAQKNDSNYIKNQYYNPNQLRIYVRNKLALSNFIVHLGITRAFANYIEGEVSFDILDDDDFEDIATAGRQNFDTSDERFIKLKEILIKIGNALVAKRQKIGDDTKKQEEKDNIDISSKSKRIFMRGLKKEIEKLPSLNSTESEELERYIISSMEGDPHLETKCEYTVFISHSRKDKDFSDFVFYYLLSLGFNGDLTSDSCEIFYSTSGLDPENLEPLSKQIKDYIIRKNNDILFLTSDNFKSSEYCLFEGGAAWATRTIGEYKILALTYESIPQFLTNGKGEIVLDIKKEEDFILDRRKYNDIVNILNRIIEHLNKNRAVNGMPLVPKLEKVVFPDKVKLAKEDKTEIQYMDPAVVEYWNKYIFDARYNYLKQQKK